MPDTGRLNTFILIYKIKNLLIHINFAKIKNRFFLKRWLYFKYNLTFEQHIDN